jgi:hypothetical protein
MPWDNIYDWGCVDRRPKVLTQIEEIAIRAVLLPATGNRRTDRQYYPTELKVSPTVIEHPIIEYAPSTTADLLCIYYLATRCETGCLARIWTVILGRTPIDRAG